MELNKDTKGGAAQSTPIASMSSEATEQLMDFASTSLSKPTNSTENDDRNTDLDSEEQQYLDLIEKILTTGVIKTKQFIKYICKEFIKNFF